jgi:hypothetical protein
VDRGRARQRQNERRERQGLGHWVIG